MIVLALLWPMVRPVPAPAAPVAPAPDAATLAIDPSEASAIAARLVGQRFTLAADHRSVHLDDIAGLGAPRVGVIERRGDEAWLIAADGAIRLTGPLARPRIAGAGYTVWVVGDAAPDGTLRARRLGVLRRPPTP